GTGSQLSVFTPHYLQADGLETRPMPGGGYLLAGASLCGGRAYALLEQFFRSTASMLGTETNSCYDAMTRLLAENPRPDDVPAVCTLFEGTRADSSLTGSISGLTTHNFTPLHLIYGVMDGMADELHRMYTAYRQAGGTPKRLIGSGNGLRQNRYLQQRFESAFGCPLTLSDGREEAAAGAAQFAAEQQI
ncbi:MAG: FGGY-family carbohydrate kinase, partial [Agathobaculum butyriciproducens]